MANRCDLWQVLIMLANRRVADLKRREFSLKRGAGREVGESALGECGDMSGGRWAVGRSPNLSLNLLDCSGAGKMLVKI